MDCSPAGSSVHEILQARILEWVAIPFSRDLPDPETESGSPTKQAESLSSEPPFVFNCTQMLLEKALYSIRTISVCILLLRKIMKETWEFLMTIATWRSAIHIFQKVNIGFTMILTGNGMMLKGIFFLEWNPLCH